MSSGAYLLYCWFCNHFSFFGEGVLAGFCRDWSDLVGECGEDREGAGIGGAGAGVCGGREGVGLFG